MALFDDLELGATLRGFTSGQRFWGRFELVRILGRGGMGVVGLAKDDALQRDVALKFTPYNVCLKGGVYRRKTLRLRAAKESNPNCAEPKSSSLVCLSKHLPAITEGRR